MLLATSIVWLMGTASCDTYMVAVGQKCWFHMSTTMNAVSLASCEARQGEAMMPGNADSHAGGTKCGS